MACYHALLPFDFCYRCLVPNIPVFPLPSTIIFPGMTIPLWVFEARYKRLVRHCLETKVKTFAIALAKERSSLRDGSPPFCEYGSLVNIVESSENADGTFSLLGHGTERCKLNIVEQEEVAEPDGSLRTLYFSQLEPDPLQRGDPNLERVAAWDAIDIFHTYAKTFFAFESLKQIDEVFPEDLVYQASFICANVRIPAESRQKLLEAKSLSQRFKLAQTFMEDHLNAYKPPRDL